MLCSSTLGKFEAREVEASSCSDERLPDDDERAIKQVSCVESRLKAALKVQCTVTIAELNCCSEK